MGYSRTSTTADRSSTAHAGKASEIAVGQMKMATVGETKVAIIRTSSGIYALDNACPHQGYGLVTGVLSDELVVCQWHNWKFDVRDGRCVQGEEDVACHAVTIDGDDIFVTVKRPSDAELRERLWPSLRNGLAANYVGQVARDTVRLLAAGAGAADIMAEGIKLAAPRTEYGPGHEMAMAADCLTIALTRTGEDQALPLVQGLSGLAEMTRDRPPRPVPAADNSPNFADAIENEELPQVMARTMAYLEANAEPAEVRHQFIAAACQHHLGYGHGIIYTQKAFELIEQLGWDRAGDLLPHLAVATASATREDLLPYMRKAMRAINRVDLQALADAPDYTGTGWADDALVNRLLDAQEAPIALATEAVLDGAGIEGLLNALTLAASRRLLRHDLEVEFRPDDSFTWLDITHVLTMSRATRWAWRCDPGPHVARLALFATWLLFDSGRAERRYGVVPEAEPGPTTGDLARAVRFKETAIALASVAGMNVDEAGEQLITSALADQSGAFIVTAHLIKLAQAASEEAAVIGSKLPLLAAARYLASPRSERFVAANVAESREFVATGKPPRR